MLGLMYRYSMKRKLSGLIARTTKYALQLTDASKIELACVERDSTSRLLPGWRIFNNSGSRDSIRIGAHSEVQGELLIEGRHGKISIGEWSYIGVESRVWSQTSVSIGNYVLISHYVDIHDTNAHPLDWRARRLDIEAVLSDAPDKRPGEVTSSAIVIEDDVWIGFRSAILKGVHIGRGAIVAAGSIVTKDVPSWSMVAGNPARIIRELDPG